MVRETRVGLCLDRGIDAIVAMIAIMKAGGAYVPIDANHPAERINYVIADAEINVLLTDQILAEQICLDGLNKVCLDADAVVKQISASGQSDITGHQLSQLAYMIYTSGSTGLPKGVMVEHRGLVNLAIEQAKAFNIDNDSKLLQFASISFDASVSEWATTFAVGAELHVTDDLTLKSPQDLGQLVHNSQITHVTLPPLLLSQLDIEQFGSVEHLIVAGEACPLESARKWSKDRHFYNAYGPSEGTVCATIGGYDPQTDRLHIGTPMKNVQVVLLDNTNQPVPIGTVGELCIGGLGLARGYLGKEQLTNERFITSDLVAGGRLYKTGDLARYTSDGKLMFIGRVDNQVKVRGFRIELGEIEYQLTQVSDVKDAVVITTDQGQAGKRLIAYVATDKQSDSQDENNQHIETYRQALMANLPDYMVPSVFVMLKTLPMTSNGKVDHKALPTAGSEMMQQAQYIAPRDETEQRLAQIWQQILNVETVGVNDNFHLLGGHSLLLMKLQTEINRLFGVELNLYHLVSNVTLASQAKLINNHTNDLGIDAVVELKAGTGKMPIYMVPGLAGHAHIFQQLAGQLTTDQSVYAFNPLGIDGEDKPHNNVADAAAYYASKLIADYDCGPCILVGYSLGASVAYEMAKILIAKGYQVPQLVVLDGKAEYDNIGQTIELNNAIAQQQGADVSGQMAQQIEHLKAIIQAQSQWQYKLCGESLNQIAIVQSQDSKEDLAQQWQGQSQHPIKVYHANGTHESILTAPEAKSIAQFMQQLIQQ